LKDKENTEIKNNEVNDKLCNDNFTNKDADLLNSLEEFHSFLNISEASGIISRQEVVSMIPTILLNTQPGDTIIDLCAAPGSKTKQLLESLDNTGFVIANEIDYKRTSLLIHQLQVASGSQCLANCIIINHPAQFIPNIYDEKNNIIKFDKVLADVPCTGDGAIRKFINKWKDWSVKEAYGIHPLQVKILERGLEMLKLDGILVCSTCSLNPIENEAVIQSVLNK